MPNDPPQASFYQAATTDAVLFERTDRASIEATGDDRAAWLHNLVTNVVKTLQPGEGNYAFAVNLKGRVLFDLNVLVLEDRLLLDVDHRWLDAAMAHLDRYIITEDVTLKVLADAHRRIAVMGPKAHEFVARMSLGNLTPMAQLQHCGVRIADADVRMIRHDFAGLPAAEFIVPSEQADAVRRALESNGPSPPWIDSDTVNILRIEAGIPAAVDDIDGEVVPPETGQIERGISYHKGCYLGQEVIERMRSHGVLARRLVGLQIEGDALPAGGAAVTIDDATVGRVTSACRSVATGGVLALGYVKSARAAPGTAVQVSIDDRAQTASIVALPVRSPSS